MNERSYTTMDKTRWGAGPWNDEPDKLQWVDEATGLDCLIVRNRLGALCGYVGVPSEHPYYVPCDVHGSLTYANTCQEGPEDEAVRHVPAAGRPSDVYWFGFDCAHAFDLAPGMRALVNYPAAPCGSDGEFETYRTVDYVRGECANLARQLAEIA